MSYILTGLNLEFNPIVSAIIARVEPITVGELYTQLVSFEQRMELHGGGAQNSSANMAIKGGRGGGNNINNNARGHGGGGHGGFGRGYQKGGRVKASRPLVGFR